MKKNPNLLEKTCALNVLYAKNEKIYLAYVSKHHSNRDES